MKKTAVRFLIVYLALFPVLSQAASYVGGETGTTAVNYHPTSTRHFTGTGSWAAIGNHNGVDDESFEFLEGGSSLFSQPVQLEDIKSVEFSTYKLAAQATKDNFYLVLQLGDRKLVFEPRFASDTNEAMNSWTTWSTSSSANRLTLYDQGVSGGGIGFPTLDGAKAGAIDWSSYTANGSGGAIDYRQEQLNNLYLLTNGSFADNFVGYVDGAKITLSDGTVRDLDFEVTGGYTEPQIPGYGAGNDRSAEITSPEKGANVSAALQLSAQLADDDTSDAVNWEVRQGTCAGEGKIVAGNQGGFTDAAYWADNRFSTGLDISSWELGYYCFSFDPREGEGEKAVSAGRDFAVVDTLIPEAAITFPTSESYVAGTMELRGTARDNHLMNYILTVRDAQGNVYASSNEVATTTSFTDKSLLKVDTTLLPNGQYFIDLWVTDTSYNYGIAMAEINFWNAASTRSALISVPAENATVTGSIELRAALSDDDNNDAAVWTLWQGDCSLSGASLAGSDLASSYTWEERQFAATIDATNWEDGAYCFMFDPTEDNAAGNIEPDIRLYRNFQLVNGGDTTAPRVAISAPTEGAKVSGTIDIVGAVTEESLASYALKIYDADGSYRAGMSDDSPAGSFADKVLLSLNTNTITNGAARAVLSATDLAGNTSSSSVHFLVDNPVIITPPEIISPAENAEVSGSVELAVQTYYTDVSDTVDWAVRRGGCSAPAGTVAGDIDGYSDPYSWGNNAFSATVETANWGTGKYCFVFYPQPGEPALQREFTLVLGNPTTPTLLGFKNPTLACGAITNSYLVTVDWSDATDANGIAGYDYSVDYPQADGSRGTWGTFVRNSEYTGSLNEGVHYVKVRAKDAVGNYSEWSNVCTITGDRTAPQVGISAPTAGVTVSGKIDVIGSVSDQNLESYALAVRNDRAETVAASGTISQSAPLADDKLWSWDTTQATNGSYTIWLQARDAAGNERSTAVEVNVYNRPVPTDMDQCKKYGWENFRYLGFKNQGNCVSYVESHK